MKKLLKKLNAKPLFIDWARDKSWPEVYETCPMGEWLGFLFEEINPEERALIRLTAAHCANTVRHLMKDDRSKALIDAIIDAKGGDVDQNLIEGARSADIGYDPGDFEGAALAGPPRTAAAVTESVAIVAALAHDSHYLAGSLVVDYSFTSANPRKTADIVRKYIPIEKFNIS